MGCGNSKGGYQDEAGAAQAADSKDGLPKNHGEVNDLLEEKKKTLTPEQQAQRDAAKRKRKEAKNARKQQLIHAADHGPPKKSHFVTSHPDVGNFATQTGSEEVHVSSVYDTFKKYMDDNDLKQLAVEGFLQQLQTLRMFEGKEDLARRLFKVMDTSKDGFLDFGELLTGLSVFNKGTRKQKLEMCFKAYDSDGDGSVEKPELRQIILCQVRATLNATAMALASHHEFDDLNVGAPIGEGVPKLTSTKSEKFELKDLEDGRKCIKIITPLGTATVIQNPNDNQEDPFVALHGDEVLDTLVDQAFEQFDKDHNGSMNFEEFQLFISMHPHLNDWFHDLE